MQGILASTTDSGVYDAYAGQIRPHAPAATSKRVGSFQPEAIGNLNVLLMKSELHLTRTASRRAILAGLADAVQPGG